LDLLPERQRSPHGASSTNSPTADDPKDLDWISCGAPKKRCSGTTAEHGAATGTVIRPLRLACAADNSLHDQTQAVCQRCRRIYDLPDLSLPIRTTIAIPSINFEACRAEWLPTY